MAYGTGFGAGKMNTLLIIASQKKGTTTSYAARACNEYIRTVNGVSYADWYLPSNNELYKLYSSKAIVDSTLQYYSHQQLGTYTYLV